MMGNMLNMPKVGQVFSTSNKLGCAVLLCINVRKSDVGMYYYFFVLDGSGSPFRCWVDTKYNLMFETETSSSNLMSFGMTNAMEVFSFELIG